MASRFIANRRVADARHRRRHVLVQQQQQRRADQAHVHAEQTTHDVVLALQIASETISAAQAKVEEITRYEPTNDN